MYCRPVRRRVRIQDGRAGSDTWALRDQAWAEDTLATWMQGPTGYDDVLGAQYRIRRETEPHTYRVETLDGSYVAGRFRVLVVVLEASQ